MFLVNIIYSSLLKFINHVRSIIIKKKFIDHDKHNKLGLKEKKLKIL